MVEPRIWSKKISGGKQIAVPAELMRALDVKVGDNVYLVLWQGQATLISERRAAPVMRDALLRAGMIGGKRSKQ